MRTPLLTMRHDFRAPASSAVPRPVLYAAAREQLQWADAHGFDLAVLSEHHGTGDGWLPAPLTMAGAVLAATRRIPVLVGAAIVPLHDPVRLAEQVAVLDNLAPGRLRLVAGAGYRAEEFAMAGVDLDARGALLEEYVGVLRRAWTGEPFEWRGRTVRVTPPPATKPHPFLLLGGGTRAAARRAARLRLPMMPSHAGPELREAYTQEAARAGFDGGFVAVVEGPTFVHVTPDPERAWAQIGGHLLEEARTYASFQPAGQRSTPMVAAETVADLRRSPQFVVGTPDDVVAAIERVPPSGAVTFHPLAGGLPPDLAWESLELFASAVLPRIRPAVAAAPAPA